MIDNFLEWAVLREEVGNWSPYPDPFITLHQKRGDHVYFGVHDLSRYYREHGTLPNLTPDQISEKMGEVVDADPVNQTITVVTSRDPFHYGYKKLEDKNARDKRKAKGENVATVKLPVNHLQSVSHLFSSPVSPNSHVWLVVDGGTKYQQDLMREIRRREVERATNQQSQPANQAQQFQMRNRHVYPAAPGPNNQQPSQPQQQQPRWSDDDLLDLQHARYDMIWKHHNDQREYLYYPED